MYEDDTQIEGVKKTSSRRVSTGVVVWVVIVVAIASFVAGTQQRQILAAIAPLFGGSAYAGQLDLSSVQETYQELKANFDGELDEQALIDGANRGMVEGAGDEYTTFMNKKESSEFEDSLNGSIGGGIGAEIGSRDGVVTIVRVLANTPAQRAELVAGDIVLRINDEDTSGWTTEQAVSKIRGEIGTTVKFELRRGEQTLEKTITREEITTPSVESEVKDGIGFLTLTRFDQQTGTLARKAAEEFVAQGVKGVVLDVRNNGGGYVTAAQDVAGLWLNNELVVTERAGDKVVEELKTGGRAILGDIPTVVLVNEYSASASEIVAGALLDHNKAKLVGKKTFGKGTVQQLIKLANGSQLKVTVARWFTPNGKNISKEGIAPTIEVLRTDEEIQANIDSQRQKAIETLGL